MINRFLKIVWKSLYLELVYYSYFHFRMFLRRLDTEVLLYVFYGLR